MPVLALSEDEGTTESVPFAGKATLVRKCVLRPAGDVLARYLEDR